MKCEHCDNPAVVHATDMVNGVPREFHLCEEHAKQRLGEYPPRPLLPAGPDRACWDAHFRTLEGWGLLGKTWAESVDPHVAVSQYVELLKHQDPQLRYYGARSLGQMGAAAKEAIPHLHQLLEDEDEYVRRAAKEALRQIEGGKGGEDGSSASP